MIITILLIIVLCLLESALMMSLWNYVITPLFAVTPISYGVACGFMFCINFVFGLFRNMSEFDT